MDIHFLDSFTSAGLWNDPMLDSLVASELLVAFFMYLQNDKAWTEARLASGNGSLPFTGGLSGF